MVLLYSALVVKRVNFDLECFEPKLGFALPLGEVIQLLTMTFQVLVSHIVGVGILRVEEWP